MTHVKDASGALEGDIGANTGDGRAVMAGRARVWAKVSRAKSAAARAASFASVKKPAPRVVLKKEAAAHARYTLALLKKELARFASEALAETLVPL